MPTAEPSTPEWLVPGAEVAVVCNDPRLMSFSNRTIEKVGKRDVVLSDGSRFNVRTLSRSNSEWSPVHYLVERNDPKVVEIRKAVRQRMLESDAWTAFDHWNRDRTAANAAEVIARFTPLTEQPTDPQTEGEA